MCFKIGDIVTATNYSVLAFIPGDIGVVQDVLNDMYLIKLLTVCGKPLSVNTVVKKFEIEIERYIPTAREINKYELSLSISIDENSYDNLLNFPNYGAHFLFWDYSPTELAEYIRNVKLPNYIPISNGKIKLNTSDDICKNHYPIYTADEILDKSKQLEYLITTPLTVGLTSNSGTELIYCNNNSVKITQEDDNMNVRDFTYEIFKSTNKKTNINKITTVVHLPDGRIGKATCNEDEYDETLGVLNAFANAVCKCKFENIVKKHIKKRQAEDLQNRTCKWCGSTFNTIEELEEHEQWHKDCRRNKKEKYKIRKRAKEILIEESAKKLANDIFDKNK